MAWPSSRSKSFVPYGDCTPSDMNAIQDQYLRSTGILDTDMDPTTVSAKLGLNGTGVVRRGNCLIDTTESVTSTGYTTLATPDQVANVSVPVGGLLVVAYQATWQQSAAAAASATIYVGSTPLTTGVYGASAPVAAEATIGANAATDTLLSTQAGGLYSNDATVAYTGDGIAGQALGVNSLGTNSSGAPCYIFFGSAAFGTFTVSVKFKASSGSVTVKKRKLWVWTMGF